MNQGNKYNRESAKLKAAESKKTNKFLAILIKNKQENATEMYEVYKA